MNRNKEICLIFQKSGLVDSVYSIENLGDIKTLLFSRKYDMIFDTEQFFFSTTLLSLFIKKRMTVGFDTNERRLFYDFFVHYKQEEYEAQSFINLLQVF